MRAVIRSGTVLLPVPVLVLLAAACWDSSGPAGETDATEDIVIETDDPGIEVGDPLNEVGDPVHDDIMVDEVIEVVEERQEEPCTSPICAADFPCRAESVCQSAGTLMKCRTIPCEEVCGTSCCTGASCGTQSTESCPEGTTCHQLIDACATWPMPYGNAAKCLPSGTVEEDGQTWIEPSAYCSYCS